MYSRFGHFGEHSYVKNPLHIIGEKNIRIGYNVHINERCWLAALPLTGEQSAELNISDGVAPSEGRGGWLRSPARIRSWSGI